MRALQMHYTSCRRGQSGNAGFQTRALTPGIGPDEQHEIERRGVYRPPRDLQPEPNDAEIARDFPRALRSYTLRSGRRALTRCGYTGRDYSGRWGNFFAHTLVIEDGQAHPLWPIDYYEWDGWQRKLDPEEDGEEAPSPLPVVELERVVPAESFRFEELQEFLREEPGRRELLAKMARAVLLGHSTSRAVVIRDTPTRGLFWIACLQKLFPPAHSLTLSWSSYQDDPRGCAAVNATAGETDFTFNESECRFRFYMFDLTTGLQSEVPEAEDDYPAVASRWLSDDPGRLEEFFAFLRLFDHHEPEPGLISAIHLFELASGRSQPPDSEQLAAMIAFASGHATAQGRVQLLDVLGHAAESAGGLARPEDYALLIRFLLEGSRATGRPEHRRLAIRTWLALLRDHLLRRRQGLEAAEATLGLLRQALPECASELAESFLSEPLWGDPEPSLRGLPPEILLFLLRITWQCVGLRARGPAWDQPEVDAVMAALLIREHDLAGTAQAILETVPRHVEPLSAVSHRVLALRLRGAAAEEEKAIRSNVGRALGRVLATADATTADAVRRGLETDAAWDILYGEWLDLAERAEDPLAAFERYRRSVLAALPRYQERCLHWIAGDLLRRLPGPRRVAVAVKWLGCGEAERFPPELAGECIGLANRAVPLDPGAAGGEEIAQLVARAAARLRAPLQPDRPLLRWVLSAVQAPHTSLRELRIDEVGRAVSALDPDEYARFLAGFLQAALERAGVQKEHQQVLLAASNHPSFGPFKASYLEFFKAKRKSPWPGCLHATLRFWLAFDGQKRDEETRRLAPLEPTAREGLVRAVGELKPKQVQTIDQRLRQARIDDRAATRWQEIQAAVEKRKRGPWARLAGVFGRQ